MQVERAQERSERQTMDDQCARTTENAVSTIKSRNGNACGSASAAASETMPRMPAHEMIRPLLHRRPQHRPWRVEPEPAMPPPDHGVERHVPRDAYDDHRHQDRGGHRDVVPAFGRLKALEDRPDLQADEDEREDVQREDDGLPHGVGRDANARGRSFGRRARHRHRIAHHRQDAGEAEVLGEDPDAERA